MPRLLAVLALALVALPVSAQDAADVTASASTAAIDAALVGDWTLMRVQDAGAMERYGAEVEDMWASFEADGSAEVRLEVMQDQDRHARTRTFQFRTESGQILASGAPPVTYEVLGSDLLVLRDPTGMVVELRRVSAR